MNDNASQFVRGVEDALRRQLDNPAELAPREERGAVPWAHEGGWWQPVGLDAPETVRWRYREKWAQVGILAGQVWGAVYDGDAPNTAADYVNASEALSVGQPSAELLGSRLAKELNGYEIQWRSTAESERAFLAIASVAIAAYIVYTFVVLPGVDCGGDLPMSFWFPNFFIRLAALGLGLMCIYCLVLLAMNRPQGVSVFATRIWQFIVLHYRRAPLPLTVLVSVAVLAMLNEQRFDLRIHTDRQHTLVHDRFFGTWRSYDWQPCPESSYNPDNNPDRQ